MAKTQQVLQIEPPSEICFKGPFTDVVTSQIRLSNPSDKQVCFKVKTTAPKQYCVRPNSGLIPPHGQVSVSVMLQPFDYNAEERSRHKFMVQTAFVPEGEQSLENIWRNTPATEMMDSKLRVVFDVPEQNNVEKITAKTSSPLMAKNTSSSNEGEFRRAVDDGKRLQSQLQQVEQENIQLRERIKKLEAQGGGSSSHGASSADVALGHMTSSVTLLHLVLGIVIATIIGLLLGKFF